MRILRIGPCCVALLLGCALDVQTIRYPEAAAVSPRPDGCEVKVLEWHRAPYPECRELADVYVGDPGLAFLNCGRKRVEERIRDEACRLGADTALLRRVRDFHSSCYQARARLLDCSATSRGQAS